MPIRNFEERFQVTYPPKDEAGEPWVWPTPRQLYPVRNTNELPTIGIDEPVMRKDQMRLVTSSETDVSKQTGAKAFTEGFTKHKLSNTDDMYTGEHTDQFYSDSGGFVERNNYLDRS